MTTPTVRCPFCDCLLDRSWSRWHRPNCPNQTDVTPDDLLEATREVERRFDRMMSVLYQPKEIP